MNTQSWQIWQLFFCSTTTIHGNHSLLLLHHHQQSTIVQPPQWPLHTPTTTAWQHYVTRQTNNNEGWPQPSTLMDVPHRPDSDPCGHHQPHYSKWAVYLPNPSPFFTQEAGVAITNVATNDGQVMTQHVNRRATSFRQWHMSSLLSSLLQVSSPHFCFHVRCRGPRHIGNMETIQDGTNNKWRWEDQCTWKGGSVRCVDWTGAWTTPKQHTHTHFKTLTHLHPLYVCGASSLGFSRY